VRALPCREVKLHLRREFNPLPEKSQGLDYRTIYFGGIGFLNDPADGVIVISGAALLATKSASLLLS
jgi:hypothetical protein